MEQGQLIGQGELLAQPTATVAAAVRTQRDEAGPVRLTAALREWLAAEFQAATGSPEWQLTHLRESRPLGEFLEVARLITAQRHCLHLAAA